MHRLELATLVNLDVNSVKEKVRLDQRIRGQ